MFSEYFYRVTLRGQEGQLYAYQAVVKGSLWDVKIDQFVQACESRALSPQQATPLDILLVPNIPIPGVYIYEFTVMNGSTVVTTTERIQLNNGATIREVFMSLYRSICSQHRFNPETTHVLNTFFVREK